MLCKTRTGCWIRSASLAIGISLSHASVVWAQDPLFEASEAIVSGSPQTAADALRHYVTENPGSADGHRLLGVALSLLGQRSAALGALGRSVQLQPGNPANQLALGQGLAQFGEHERARNAFRAAIELDPKLSPAHEGVALSLALEGALEEALPHFTAAIEHAAEDSARARLHYLRGKARAQRDQLEMAVTDFETAAGLQPTFGAAYLEWGRSLAGGTDPIASETVLRKAANLMPDSFEAHHLYGSQLLRNGNPEAAVEPLRRANQLEPSNQIAGYALGRALRAAGKADEARDVLSGLAAAASRRILHESKINEAGRLNNLGLEAQSAGNIELALRRYEEAAAIAPRNIDFHRNAALALCRLERWDEAKARLRKVLRMAPGDVDATKALYIALDHAPD